MIVMKKLKYVALDVKTIKRRKVFYTAKIENNRFVADTLEELLVEVDETIERRPVLFVKGEGQNKIVMFGRDEVVTLPVTAKDVHEVRKALP